MSDEDKTLFLQQKTEESCDYVFSALIGQVKWDLAEWCMDKIYPSS